MLLITLLFAVSGIYENDSKFLPVPGIEPYLHYSAEHDRLFFLQRDEADENTLQLKAVDSDGEIHFIGSINYDGSRSLHNYHISIGNSKALIKRESQMRPGQNRFKFVSINNHAEENYREFHAPYITDGLYHLVNDSTVYVKERRDTLYMSKILHLKDDFETISKNTQLFSYNYFPQWKNTKENHLLKNKMKAVSDSEGNTCSIFMYSSWLLCSTLSGEELFASDLPDQVNFPDIPPFKRGDALFRSGPDAEEHRVQSVDIAMDSNHIYLLVFGRDLNRRTLMRAAFSGQRFDLDEFTTTTDRVYLYYKHSGEFLREITLPGKSRAITADPHHLIVVEEGDDPGIRWIPKTEYTL